MKKFIGVICVGIVLSQASLSQTITQTVKGTVVDEATRSPLPFATIIINGSDPLIGTTTDIDGNFILERVPIGRHSFTASYLGYESLIISEVLVTRAREVSLEFKLSEKATSFDEIVVNPRVQKSKAINRTAIVSSRMLSVEEASRYAGGFDDPARLATSFAGVATSNISNNAIIIRGNSPKYLQWKLEGVEIPNPNHFADLNVFGSGGLTALSSNLLSNSDFLTGAFPAEYNNAIAGVFDIRMRPGNNDTYEHSFQAGLIGIDLASEGPINRKKNQSYLFNYRYSTLGLIEPVLPEDASRTNYQDLSLKLKFPTKKAGIFSVWGIGLIDNSGELAEADTTEWEYDFNLEEGDSEQYMGAGGIGHDIILGKTSYIHSTAAISTSGLRNDMDMIQKNGSFLPESVIDNIYANIILKSYINNKFSKNHSNRTGFTITNMRYDILLKERGETSSTLETIVSEKGASTLLSGFTNSTFTRDRATINLGVNGQYFTLNKNYTIEPRLGLTYKINSRNELSFGYGLHSRLEPINIYFTGKGQGSNTEGNKNLDLTKAHHIVLGLNSALSDHLQLKIEPYFQYLFDVPVIRDSTYSILNEQSNWFVNETFENAGEGINYGIDFTLEQYFHKGLYFMITASLFDSRYKTNLNAWHSTRYNKGYLVNVLMGKEYKAGRSKQNIFGVNLRVSIQGGERYSLINETRSALLQEVVYDETTPFTEQARASFVSYLTVNYIWNSSKNSKELSLKILNLNAYKEFLGHDFNLISQKAEEYTEALIIPNLSWKISF